MKKLCYILVLWICAITSCSAQQQNSRIEQRQGYRVELVEVPVSHDVQAKGYLLVPDSVPAEGCPAILACHDHGARFSIGKEKLCRPIVGESESAKTAEAEAWVEKFYEGQFVADTLANRGYIVLVIDALYWGSRMKTPSDLHFRGGDEISADSLKRLNKRLKEAQPVFYEAHLQQTGEPWFETILADDKACIDYLLTRKEVNPNKIGVWGFSMGAYRAWQLAAEDPRIAFCAAANWMTTRKAKEQIKENNIKNGKLQNAPQSWQISDVSAYSMYRPSMDSLDYGTIAARIAPRPFLLQYGTEDKQFGPSVTLSAAETFSHAYNEQNNNILAIKSYPAGHIFTKAHLSDLLLFINTNQSSK